MQIGRKKKEKEKEKEKEMEDVTMKENILFRKHFVYFIIELDNNNLVEGFTGYCKIGFTVDLNKRISELQTGNPRLLHCYCCVEISCRLSACKLETMLHQISKGRNQLREWYRLSLAEIDYLCQLARNLNNQV